MRIGIILAAVLGLSALVVYQTHKDDPPHQRTKAEIDSAIERDMDEAKQKAAGDAAYNEGLVIGRAYGAQGYAVPTDLVLRSLANDCAQKNSVPLSQRRDWSDYFRGGFEHGYKEVTKKAF